MSFSPTRGNAIFHTQRAEHPPWNCTDTQLQLRARPRCICRPGYFPILLIHQRSQQFAYGHLSYHTLWAFVGRRSPHAAIKRGRLPVASYYKTVSPVFHKLCNKIRPPSSTVTNNGEGSEDGTSGRPRLLRRHLAKPKPPPIQSRPFSSSSCDEACCDIAGNRNM